VIVIRRVIAMRLATPVVAVLAMLLCATAAQACGSGSRCLSSSPMVQEMMRERWIADARDAEARRLSDAGQYEAALAVLAGISPDRSGDHGSFLLRAQLRREHGDLMGAMGDLDLAARLGPNSAGMLVERCLVHARLGDARSAAADCDAAVGPARARREDSFAARYPYLVRAGVALMRQDRRAADRDIAEALRGRYPDSMALRLRAWSRTLAGDDAGARADVAAARRAIPRIDAELEAMFGQAIPPLPAAAAGG
jgi:hypothetical protein